MAELWTPDSALWAPEQEITTPEQQAEWNRYVAMVPVVAKRLVRPHIEAPDSILVEYYENPEDPFSLIGKDPAEFYVAGNPQPQKAVDFAAEEIAPGYAKAREKMLADPRSSAIFDMVYDLVERGESVVINTLHIRDLRDIAVAQKAADDAMLIRHRQKYGKGEDYEDRSWQTLLLVNKAMAWAAPVIRGQRVGVMPTTQILENHVLLPWPITESSQSERANLPETWLRWNNRSVRRVANILFGKEVPKDLGDRIIPPQLAAIAMTGTTRLATGENGKSKVGEISDAAIEMILGLHVLGMTAIFNRSEPVMHPVTEPVRIESAEQMDELVQLQVDDYNEHEPGINLVHEPPARRQRQR